VRQFYKYRTLCPGHLSACTVGALSVNIKFKLNIKNAPNTIIEMSKNIVLFDMDGTLTPARKPIQYDMVKALVELSAHADIGIVTGSGFDYLKEQCRSMWVEIGSVRTDRIYLLPCNGTQLYRDKEFVWHCEHSVDMKEKIGAELYADFLAFVLDMQKKLIKKWGYSLPFTGNFLSYRQSLLNWCPIGRDAGETERNAFKEFDTQHRYRIKGKKKLERMLKERNIASIEITLGGQTSLDIFPVGWNKTYALQHFPGWNTWFIGDRCMEGGNDKAIYDVLKKKDQAFHTSGPEETIKTIEEIIVPNLQVNI
jgi:phosphomannomutase